MRLDAVLPRTRARIYPAGLDHQDAIAQNRPEYDYDQDELGFDEFEEEQGRHLGDDEDLDEYRSEAVHGDPIDDAADVPLLPVVVAGTPSSSEGMDASVVGPMNPPNELPDWIGRQLSP